MQEELEAKEEKKVAAKSKKYVKKMKELRMAVRSSLYSKERRMKMIIGVLNAFIFITGSLVLFLFCRYCSI